MTLQSSGAISLCNVATELGRASGTMTSLVEAAVRSLAGVVSGPISLSGLYGKSSESFWHASLGAGAFNYRLLGTDSSGNIYACASMRLAYLLDAFFEQGRIGAVGFVMVGRGVDGQEPCRPF
jgi:hypothetical protein